MPPIPYRAGTLVAIVATALLAGCGSSTGATPVANTPISVRPSRVVARTPASTLPTTAPARLPATPTGPVRPSFADAYAVPCAGYPSGEQVVTLLRRSAGLLPARVTATVATGPMCAGAWQYTVVTVPDRDPLQVVTYGRPTALHLVTAGTDVCTVEVRASAPAGIRLVANCSS